MGIDSKHSNSSATEGRGTLDSRVTVLVLPSATVRKLLPAGLELAPQPVVPFDWHPVFLLCSHATGPMRSPSTATGTPATSSIST